MLSNFVHVVTLTALCCCSSKPSHSELVLSDRNGRLFAKLRPDGNITENSGRVVAHYDNHTNKLTFEALAPGAPVDVNQAIAVRGPRDVDVIVGGLQGFRYHVSDANELTAVGLNGDNMPLAETPASVGHLEGYSGSESSAFWLGVLMCGSLAVTPAHPPLVLLDAKDRLVGQITFDGSITDHDGHVLGTFDKSDDTLRLNLQDIADLDRIVHLGLGVTVNSPRDVIVWPNFLSYLMPPRRIRVAESGALTAQRLTRDSFPNAVAEPGAIEEPSGHLKDYYPDQDNARRLAAMLYALPMASPVDPNARLPVEQPPPPPPPPVVQH